MLRFVLFSLFTIMNLFCLISGAQANVRCIDIWKKSPNRSQDILHLMKEHTLSETQQGVPPEHQTQFLLHSSSNQIVKTDVVVLVYHGLMNSPRDMKFLASDLHKMGANVINARLDGHFEKSRTELDTVEYQDWVAQLDGYLAMARQLGQKVIIVGHSTGGLAGIHTAIENKVDGLILLAPALKTRTLTDAMTYVGSMLKISGWILDAFKRFRKDRYKSTYAGVQVDRWGDLLRDIPGEQKSTPPEFGLVQERLKNTPLLWFDTEIDWVIDPQYNQRIAERLENVESYTFPRAARVLHNSMAVPKMNSQYPQMVEMIRNFIAEH